MESTDKRSEIEALRARLRELEEANGGQTTVDDLEDAPPVLNTSNPDYYFVYYVMTGSVLGLFGALASLVYNIVGALVFGQYPLQLIRVYLTFPLGEAALQIDAGVALAIGCCLYMATGALLGIPFHLAQSRWLPNADFPTRVGLATVLGLGLWLFNFYGVLSWLQPLLFGGNWIVREIPIWVAASTHVVFGWAMALMYPLGVYVPYDKDSAVEAEGSA